MKKPLSFQGLIASLKSFWAKEGCTILEPYDLPMGAGTFHSETFFRSLGTKPFKGAFVQPSRRPTDGRYGENPNRLQKFYQFQLIIKPSPKEARSLYLRSLEEAVGLDLSLHDIRFVEDNWESPTLGAGGLGWEVWLDGMEVSQFTYFQQMAGMPCQPTTLELTYGLERLCMYLQGVNNVYDLVYSDAEPPVTYGELFQKSERESSAYNFEQADISFLEESFKQHQKECQRLLLLETPLVIPAYEHALLASHCLNMLEARGSIGVDERKGYILNIRKMTTNCAKASLKKEERELESKKGMK